MLIQHKSFSDPTSFQLYLSPREKYHHIQTPPFLILLTFLIWWKPDPFCAVKTSSKRRASHVKHENQLVVLWYLHLELYFSHNIVTVTEMD